jgi:hypothetical protein
MLFIIEIEQLTKDIGLFYRFPLFDFNRKEKYKNKKGAMLLAP